MIGATAIRVVQQLRHDPRTMALIVVVPAALLVLLRFMFNSAHVFSASAPALLGIFPFLLMFLICSVTTLRERTSGTLERILTTPLPKIALLLGYGLAFGVVAVVQVAVSVLVSFALGMTLVGPLWALVVVAMVNALLGVALGLFASAFARTEFQAIQLMPIVVLPQILLCGLFVPRDQMAAPLTWISDALPMSYAIEALQHVSTAATVDGGYWLDLAILAVVCALALALAAATLRRRTG